MKVNGVIWVLVAALSVFNALGWWWFWHDIQQSVAVFLATFMTLFVALVVAAAFGWINGD